MFEYPDLEDLLAAATALGVPHVRDLGLLESAAQRPQLALYGSDMYPTLAQKSAAILESIVKNHPLLDGNKRLGWVSVSLLLEFNGVILDVPDDDVYDFVVGVAAGDINWDQMVSWFQARI